jgi:hypothetical protein
MVPDLRNRIASGAVLLLGIPLLLGANGNGCNAGGTIPIGSGAPDAGGSADAHSEPCMISASSYDASCTVDTDCQEVTSTNYCAVNCLCGGSAINVGALAQFNADIAKTPLGSGALGGVIAEADGSVVTACSCPPSPGPCCRNGTCTTTCLVGNDAGDAGEPD